MYKSTRITLLLALAIFAIQSALADAPVNYYNSALGKSDESLMLALRNIIRNHREVSYSSGLLNAFAIADVDDQGYIIDIYSNCRYRPSDNGSSAKTLGQGYNREHSFPRSWFGGAVSPMNTDVFHVYPTDIHVNSQRGNHPYGVCANGTRLSNGSYVAKGKLGKSTYPGYNGTVFEPDDEYKGDLARTYFYMATCYKNELPSWPGSEQLNYGANKYKAFSTWTINMLMEWTRLDPVSEKEKKRNEAIYGIQGNRNPFIDHPELAEFIWGNMQGKPWSGSGQEVAANITTPVNGSLIDLGETVEGKPLEYTITVKGEGLTKNLVVSMEDNEYFYVDKTYFTPSEVNSGTSFVIGFTADDLGTFSDIITLSNSEVSVTFTVTATAVKQGDNPDPPVVLGDSIMEDWEGCTSGGYWTEWVEGHQWIWDFIDAGIWGDTNRHGELVCRFGKTNASSITMVEDVEGGTTAIGLWAASYGSDANADLRVDFSTNKGSSWNELASFTVTRGGLQHYTMDIPLEGNVRFRIVQTSGTRVNIDDITIFGRKVEPSPLIGDVNNDGEVNIADMNAVIDLILGGTADDATLSRADVNMDGEITIADFNSVADIVLNK